MEVVDFEIFRMTTFSTNGNVDGKEGKKGICIFQAKYESDQINEVIQVVQGSRVDELAECGGLWNAMLRNLHGIILQIKNQYLPSQSCA